MKFIKGFISISIVIGCVVACLRFEAIAGFFYNNMGNSDTEVEALINRTSQTNEDNTDSDDTNTTQETEVDTLEDNNQNNDVLEEAIILKVVDGDTVLVTTSGGTEVKIRLIGVDCPESVNPDVSKNTEEGKIASEYTKEQLTPGMTVYLQYDQELYDVHGRTLAYLWLSESVDVNNENDIIDYMYNARLIMNDVADPKVYLPNNKYADIFEQLKELREELKTKNNAA